MSLGTSIGPKHGLLARRLGVVSMRLVDARTKQPHCHMIASQVAPMITRPGLPARKLGVASIKAVGVIRVVGVMIGTLHGRNRRRIGAASMQGSVA